jgi:hypothetical protein
MNLLTGASIASMSIVAFQGIAPPQDRGIQMSYPSILPPGAEIHEPREDAEERKQRLMDAGVVPTPPPPIIEKGKVEKDVAKILDSAKNGDKLKAAALRVEADFGGWIPLRNPTGVTYNPDFSNGLSILYKTEGGDIEATSFSPSTFVGAQALFVNSTGYQDSPGRWGGTKPLFFESSAAEYGLVAANFGETRLGENQSWGFAFRAMYLPLRWVKARNFVGSIAGAKSEAMSHFQMNYFGVGGEGELLWTYGRLVEVGLLAGLNCANPLQVRLRYGLRLALLDRGKP